MYFELRFIMFFAGLKIRDIELASRAVLPRFYAADVRKESYEVFDKCKRKVVVTANPTLMVEPFVKDREKARRFSRKMEDGIPFPPHYFTFFSAGKWKSVLTSEEEEERRRTLWTNRGIFVIS